MFNLDKLSPHGKVTVKQSVNFFAGDLVGTVVEGAVIAGIDKFDRVLPIVPAVIKGALRGPAYLFQRPIEGMMNVTKNIEGKDNFNERTHKTDAERIDAITNGAYRYGSAITVGYGAMMATERALSKMTKTPAVPMGFYGADIALHLGLVGLMGLPALSGATDKIKSGIKCLSKSVGASDQMAEDVGRVGMVSIIPNYTVFAVNTGRLYMKNKREYENLGEVAWKLMNHPHGHAVT